MSILIIKPHTGEIAYEKAAEAFRDMYEKVTGITLPVATEDDGVSDLVLIGSDAVNDIALECYLSGELGSFDIRYGTDDYAIRSLEKNGRTYLFLAGGRGRSTLYAVYDYFERVGGCHYFWDGDVIPKKDSLPLGGISVTESPRFEYRGLRYFAHRGLWRFQAEHWSFEDWQREIDWMVKRRLNFFMLRIGMDDLWQRTFPEDVPYPDPNGKLADEEIDNVKNKGYNDRSPFWPLEFRGLLRKNLLKYAFDRDLMHPEDCGTMSHWYSPAPDEFLNAHKPDFLAQTSTSYSNPQTMVWDFRKQRNMDNYMKLTEGYVREYNPDAALFHTIGLGERMLSQSREENLRIKKAAYRKISQSLRERYPNSKLFIAGWDFFHSWEPDEVKEVIPEFDPERTIIMDYTSESDDPAYSFLNWGYAKKFPWIFGLFHAYEPESSLRGPYDRSDERLRVAVEDEKCKGMIFWPELSHSDPLVLEYLTQNAWSPLTMTVEQIAERYCERRYGKHADTMNKAWQSALPIIKTVDWGGVTKRKPDDEDWVKYIGGSYVYREMWTDARIMLTATMHQHVIPHFVYRLHEYAAHPQYASQMLRTLAALPNEAWQDGFILRDGVDLARSIIGRMMNLICMKAMVQRNRQKLDEIEALRPTLIRLLDDLTVILACHDDHSMNATLEKIANTCPINKNFELTLKRNIANTYCRQYAYEMVRELYPKEINYVFDILCNPEKIPPKEEYEGRYYAFLDKFMATPLGDIRPNGNEDLRSALLDAADCMDTLDVTVE